MTASNVQSRSVFYTSRDGLKLHVRLYESDPHIDLPTVICLPGLSRNARDFDGLAQSLAADPKLPVRVACFDLRGRGLSEYDPHWQNYNILTEAEDVVAGLTALGIEHAVFVGTSRGGLITMLLGAMRPGALRGVVLNDVGPVIEGAGLMNIRSYLQRAPKPRNWDEAIQAQKSIMVKTFSAFTDKEWEYEAWSRYSEDNGVIKADFDPNLVKTLPDLNATSVIPSVWPQFMSLAKVPTLVIRGEHSNILSVETVEQMGKVHPSMRAITIEGQGHAPMLHTSGIDKEIGRLIADVFS